MKLPFFRTPKNSTKERTRKLTRKLTPEQVKEKSEAKRLQYMSDEYIALAKKDPKLRRQMIAQAFELKLPEEPNEIEIKQKEIKTKIVEKALEQIERNPELLERFTEKQIEQIIGEAPSKEGEEYSSGSAIGQVLEELDNYEELKSRFGGKSGPLGGLINAELLTELAKQTPTILAILQGKQLPPSPTTYVVEVNGQLRETDAEGYKQLLEQRELKRLEAGKKPEKAEVTEGEPVPEEATPAVVELEEPKPELELDLTLLADYLDEEPIPFIDGLVELQQNDNPEATFILNLISENDADTIIKMLQPFKANEEYRRIVEKLEQKQRNEGWLQVAIDYHRSFGSD